MVEKAGSLIVANFGSSKVEVKKRGEGGCSHSVVVVDPDSRVVRCKMCAEVLDPVEVLIRYAKHADLNG